MAVLTARGIRFGVDDRGSGDPPFVFIHGWACERSLWGLQLDALSSSYRCVAIDLRGRGESDPVPPFDTSTAADDVAAVMDELGLERAIIVGHSLGGLVALLFASRHSQKVLGTVLIDPPLNAAASGSFVGTVERLRAAGSMEPVRGYIESFFVDATPEALREKVRSIMLACPVDVAAGTLENTGLFETELGQLLKRADEKPFMALWPSKPLGDPERLRAITYFLRQEPVPNTGHFLHLENPAVTNALLRAFVDDVERDPRLNAPTAS